MTSTLKILLDRPYKRTDFKAHLFIPGDMVSGEVALDTRDGRFYKLDTFSQRKTLFQGPFKFRASTYKYPFALQFPEQLDYGRTNLIEDALFPGHIRLGPHPLPPTCYDDTRSGKCSIYYSLSVKILRSIGS
jgi:hypothetical protein